ncbi:MULTISPECIES: iron-containing alcohol dehydrogenase [Photobacterium]|uniref:Alcohol dehydrogenase n=1 Tax=Photobacterium ganghwense TaxID=320778 RepID=A0A0J1K8W6_9GAMM|nr:MULTISPECIES: iron-containing alcohol dehydrogenase [Photobacterium]KLV10792.1 alcohol dehydrogenase [Photobacterium ganghwense]MBV1842925.1 iron-containing alcohol dehydrogenase [Photobacterium ganghwense]PSU11036.1 alcohol dehydrogenase [Photobacterium ganghwense]QSV13140.1 iron-containing alcohol dehydrogenase [Photobacterium ganghwense]
MFQFMTSTRIVFGEGALVNSLSALNQFGYSVLLVTGKSSQRAEPVIHYLKQQGMRYQQVAIHDEPLIAMVEEMAAMGRKFRPDMVLAIGGGSVLDTGKALAALIPNQGSVYDYVEVVGRCVPFQAKPLPFIAVPTTAGTGSEVSKNAVLRSAQENVKVSLRSPDMLADLAIVDPTLTYGMDQLTSACCGMDAFTHLMESYVCGAPNPLTDMVCEEGLRRLAGAILPACEDDDPRARSDMSFAAMLGGMALANAKLGAAHGLASSLGGRLKAPHGLITAQLAPYVMQENVLAAREAGRADVLNRYRQLACLLTGRMNAEIIDGILWTKRTLKRLNLPQVSEYGLCRTMFDEVAEDALRSNAIKGNPLPLNKVRLLSILTQMCQCSDTAPDSLGMGLE